MKNIQWLMKVIKSLKEFLLMEKRVIQVDERVPILIGLPLSLQHLCAMFGATILVPFLFKVDPTTCIFLNGIGTLLYIFLTKMPFKLPLMHSYVS